MGYNAYYLYKKYITIGDQPPVPFYPETYSVSGDSENPMPLVLKEENSVECGYTDIVYRWHQLPISMASECSAGTKYYVDIYQVSHDGGLSWEDVVPTTTRIGDVYETGSSDCIEYRWVVSTGYVCSGTNKMTREIEEISYDSGTTWTPTGDERAAYPLIQADSPDCGYVPPTPIYRWVNMDITTDYVCDDCPEEQYRWVASTGYVCSGTNKMTREIEEVSYDSGATWTPTGDERAAYPLIEADSEDCGYVPPTPTPQYRTLTTATTCINYDKYVLEEYQVSYDSGVTWTTTGTSATTLIEADSPDCGYIPPSPYKSQYLTFVPTVDSLTFTWNAASGVASSNTVSYSLDSGNTWATLSSGETTPSVAVGQKIMWKATDLPVSERGIGRFGLGILGTDRKFDIEGNIMSLVSGDSFANATTITNNYQFYSLFAFFYNLNSAENLILPATTLTYRCYSSMLDSCTSLTKAPELPATTLAERCYSFMFANCTNLTTAPELSATTLANDCYWGMFKGCTSLTTVPDLLATTMAENCYQQMFQGCTSLTTVKVLPATRLAQCCYWMMFASCTSLTTVPSNMLPATTVAASGIRQCYQQMFENCTSLTTAPVLPATDTRLHLSGNSYMDSLCYVGMFKGCTNLSYVKMLAENITRIQVEGSYIATDFNQWLDGVSSTGTFVKNANATWYGNTNGVIPSGWTVTNN